MSTPKRVPKITALVDGYFGLQSHNALMSYQREYGLAADGSWVVASDVGLRRIDPRGPQTAATAASGAKQ